DDQGNLNPEVRETLTALKCLASTSSGNCDGPTVSDVAVLLRAIKEMPRFSGRALQIDHREREAMRYFLEWEQELSQSNGRAVGSRRSAEGGLVKEESKAKRLVVEFILVADDRWESKEAREAAAKEVLAAEMAAAEAATDGEGGGRGGREKRRRGCVD
ncbi:Hypothetical protein NocV09_09500010, partial [Nannochloropsis oceanica]